MALDLVSQEGNGRVLAQEIAQHVSWEAKDVGGALGSPNRRPDSTGRRVYYRWAKHGGKPDRTPWGPGPTQGRTQGRT